MENIQLLDKCFKPYMRYEEIQKAVDEVAAKINDDFRGSDDIPIFLGVLTGSFMFLADLMKRIEFPCDVVFIRVASYDGTQSSGAVKQVLGLTKSVKDRKVVIVEDIVDSGATIAELNRILGAEGAKEIKVCTLLYKPDNYKGSMKIDYAALHIPSDFIVGYGLDYNQLGRQYKDIYVLDEKATAELCRQEQD